MNEASQQSSEQEQQRLPIRKYTPRYIGRVALTPQEERLDNMHEWLLVQEQMRAPKR